MLLQSATSEPVHPRSKTRSPLRQTHNERMDVCSFHSFPNIRIRNGVVVSSRRSSIPNVISNTSIKQIRLFTNTPTCRFFRTGWTNKSDTFTWNDVERDGFQNGVWERSRWVVKLQGYDDPLDSSVTRESAQNSCKSCVACTVLI